MKKLILSESEDELHSEVVSEHAKRAMQQHLLDAMSASKKVVDRDNTLAPLPVVFQFGIPVLSGWFAPCMRKLPICRASMFL